MKRARNAEQAAASVDVLDRVFELAGLMGDYMELGLADRKLTRARAEVVWRLRQSGPVTQRQLSEALRVTPRNVTGLLDALQSAGFVDRSPHPTDRRAILVTLTDEGAQAATAMARDHRRFAAMLFHGVPSADMTGFAATLDVVLDRLRTALAATDT
jgi:DNA-binding MarR family transcriptional regulator